MSYDLSFLQSNKRIKKEGIKTETSRKIPIENEQNVGLSHDALFEKTVLNLRNSYPELIIRNNPTDCYNCHGMTFASRRTGVYENSEVVKILTHDSYKSIKLEDVMPGDIVIYHDPEHSGMVLSVEKSIGIIPKILSKWGMTYEAIHSVYLCPYDLQNIVYYRCCL